MTQLQTRITTAIATGAVLLSSVAPAAFAADTIVIQGNDRGSDNNVAVTNNNSNVVSQTSTANIVNNTVVNSNTGNNKANDNDGDVHVTTGDTNANVDVRNNANNNVANINGCCNNGTEVVVSGNARNSDNNVALSQNNSNVLFQTNAAEVVNNTQVNTNTGNNRANDNGGNVHMTTGQTNANINVKTAANQNVASIGGGMGAGNNNPGVSAYIIGNARNSDNNIALSLNNSAVVNQVNSAAVLNSSVVNSNTGNNDANDNWGDVHVTTGKTNANINHDTAVNFNAADLGNCGCMDIFAKIGGNARNSDNNLALTKNNANQAFQTSAAFVNNNAVDNANTGNNDANDNGSSVYSDPTLTTGQTNSNVTAKTSANTNVLESGLTLPNNSQVNFSWDMNGLMLGMWGWMAAHM